MWILGIHLYDDDDNDTIHVQVVIERPSLRPGAGAATKETDEDVVLLYIAQLAALAVLLTAMWVHVSRLVTSYSHLSSVLRLLVLISIRRGLVKLKREVTRLLSLISGPSLIREDGVILL